MKFFFSTFGCKKQKTMEVFGPTLPKTHQIKVFLNEKKSEIMYFSFPHSEVACFPLNTRKEFLKTYTEV